MLDLHYNTADTWKNGNFVPQNMDEMWDTIREAVTKHLNEEQVARVIGACLVAPLGHTNGYLTVATPFPNWPVSDYGRSLTEPVRELFPQAKYVDVFSGGLFRNGRAVYGTNNIIGAWGHIIVDPSDLEPCSCGSHGCLERLYARSGCGSG